jgi:hypothetical protein
MSEVESQILQPFRGGAERSTTYLIVDVRHTAVGVTVVDEHTVVLNAPTIIDETMP